MPTRLPIRVSREMRSCARCTANLPHLHNLNLKRREGKEKREVFRGEYEKFEEGGCECAEEEIPLLSGDSGGAAAALSARRCPPSDLATNTITIYIAPFTSLQHHQHDTIAVSTSPSEQILIRDKDDHKAKHTLIGVRMQEIQNHLTLCFP